MSTPRRAVITWIPAAALGYAYPLAGTPYHHVNDEPMLAYLRRLRFDGIPADAVLVHAFYSPTSSGFILELEHSTFREVGYGAVPPSVNNLTIVGLADAPPSPTPPGVDAGSWRDRPPLL